MTRPAAVGSRHLKALALRAALAIGAVLLPAQCATVAPPVPPPEPVPLLSVMLPPDRSPGADLADRAAHVLANRCVACHGCYDAPCQLKLSSHDGLLRGAAKTPVYNQSRLTDAPPTRLGIDAQSEASWRALGFHAVLPEGTAPDDSAMARLLALGRANRFAPGAPLPEAVSLDPAAAVCPAPDELDTYAAAAPHGGMPYGVAPLEDDKFETLAGWLLSGAPPPSPRPAPPAAIIAQVAAWERFLNTLTPRERLVARYLYEHLFQAKLHFDGDAPDRFFRLIRSETPPGAPPREIATRRPYDDPGQAFHYRLAPLDETPVHKDQNVYTLGPDRMARLRELFLSPGWTVDRLPPYGVDAGANPFATFAAIPPESRYRFLLDDTLFFVRGFVRGPVCHGQIATDVIEDRFWVAFLDPGWDLSVTDAGLLAEGAASLKLPAASAESAAFARLWPALHDGQADWLALRDARYAASPPHRAGLPAEAIWSGPGDPFLTVFRHFDNAAVRPGLVGQLPETAWVIDYPILERIYYDLVAGYDVFGSVETQLTTRLYMDHLRREAEDLFLAFLPPETRPTLHDAWYRGPLADLHAAWTARRSADDRRTAIAFRGADPKAEFLGTWVAAGEPGLDLNRCVAPCGADTAARALSTLGGEGGPWLRFLPDLTLLRVRREGEADRVFSLIRDKAHTNVGLLLGEDLRREPEKDRLTVAPGIVGAYPNFHLDIAEAESDAFARALGAMRSEADWMALIDRFGVRRTSPRFWKVYDAMNAELVAVEATAPGVLDLGRYRDPWPGEATD